MAYIVMAYIVMALYIDGLYSYGLCSYGLETPPRRAVLAGRAAEKRGGGARRSWRGGATALHTRLEGYRALHTRLGYRALHTRLGYRALYY